MAISRTLDSNNFLYFLITSGVLVTTFHMFNLAIIDPCFHNHQGYGLPSSTKGIHFVNLADLGKETSANKVTNDEKTSYNEISYTGHFDTVYNISIPLFCLASSKTSPEEVWTISNSGSITDYRKKFVVPSPFGGFFNASGLAGLSLEVCKGPQKIIHHRARFVHTSGFFNASYNNEHGKFEEAGAAVYTNMSVLANQPITDHSYVVITVIFICAMILTLVIVLFKFVRKHKRQNNEEDQITNQEGSTETTFRSCSPRPFSFEELLRATNNFHQDQTLGKGGFGAVYKAVFPNGQTVAVKRVSSTSQQGVKEYKAEVTIVSRSNHRHLVQLIGWCHEIKGELLLVYELMENKSLDVHLFDPNMDTLAWSLRYKIAQGLAKALRYLHEECGQQSILHMDIKSSNVLLDSSFEPKLGDFGLSKLVDHDKSMELSVMAGTRGYLAPECVLTGKVSTHSDVYSFGVVALELATGRKTIDPTAEENRKVLVKWVQNLYKAGKVMEAVDPKLGDDYNKLQVKGLIVVGLWCVLHDFRKRPSMREIVRILNNTQDPLLDLHIPSLVPDAVPFDFDSIRETSFRSLDLIVPMETENPIPVDPMILSSGDTVSSEDKDQTYTPLFMWRHISVQHLWRYLIDVMWFRSSHNG